MASSGDPLETLTRLRKRVDEHRREADKAEGALERVLAQLKEEFGCSTVEEGERLLARLQRHERKARARFEGALEEFEREFPE